VHPAISLSASVFSGAIVSAIGWLALVPAPGVLLGLNGYQYPLKTGSERQSSIEEVIELRASQIEAQFVYIRAEERVLSLRSRDLGLLVDREAALAGAQAGVAKVEITWDEAPGVWLWRRFSRKPVVYELPLKTQLVGEQAKKILEHLAARVEVAPRNAELLIAEHKILPSREGIQLSVAATVVRLEAAELEDTVFVDAALSRVRPRVTEDDLAPVDVTKVLASYETSYRGHAGARAVNIRTAARYLNGAIILPGEVFSFNDIVGRRIHGRGFVDAPVIVNDEMEMDVGGGVCQVATTLHAAAVFGNMEVVRRRSHSRPSSYAPLGLDATVVDGKVDLRLRNPFDEPVLVHVSFPTRFRIRVELLGRNADAKVSHAFSVTHREPYARRVWHKDEIPLGGFKKKQKGREGMEVVSVLRIEREDGSEVRRSYRSKYYPVPEVFWLGEGASTVELPEMLEGTAGLVIDGEEVGIEAEEEEEETQDEEEVPSLL